MSRISLLRTIALAWTIVMFSGCVILPIPGEESVVSGRVFTEDELQTMISGAESPQDVKAKLGEPKVDFGPERVFVYLWTIKKGYVIMGAWGVDASGPWLDTNSLFVAFDSDGKMLKTGVAKYAGAISMSKNVRNWLKSVGLADRVVGSRLGNPAQNARKLFVYYPSSSLFFVPWFDPSFYQSSTNPCPFPLHDIGADNNASIKVDGKIVGDLAKGEYLATNIGTGSHELWIEPRPYFGGPYPNITRNPKMLHINLEPDQAVYIEIHVCTGLGPFQMNAIVRDYETAIQAMRGLQPAW